MRTLTSLLLLVFLLGSPALPQQAANPVILAPSIHALDVLLEYDLKTWLNLYRPGGTHLFAVMHVADNERGVFVSLAGLDPNTPPPYKWRLEDGNVLWTGTLRRVAGDLELYQPEQVSKGPGLARLSKSWLAGGAGGGPDIAFPFAAGTKMLYGTRGIHGGGFSFGSGVDLVSGDDLGSEAAPNVVYASAAGTITNVCTDGTSTGIKVVGGENSFGYFHLVNDASLSPGTSYGKGDPIGRLVYGSFDDTCGWAEQQPNHYHLHWVIEMASGKFQAEGWQLQSSDGKWHRGTETVSTGKWLLGGGGAGSLTDDPGSKPSSTLVIVPGRSSSGGGSSLWDYLITGVNSIYGVFKTWYIPASPVNADNEKMWGLALAMMKTMIKDANIYLVNDAINIVPLVLAYSVMLFLEGIKWLAVITLSVFNLAKDIKGLVATS